MNNINKSIRFELAPINTGYAKSGIFDSRIVSFHNERSGKGISASYIGNIATKKSTSTNSSTAVFCKENIEILKETCRTIQRNGSTAAAQIAARLSSAKAQRTWEYPKEQHIQLATSELASLKENEIQNEIDHLLNAAIGISNIGFEIIQLHAAHGYFLSRLFNRVINTRNDNFAFGNFRWIQDFLRKFADGSPSPNLEIRVNLRDDIEDYNEEFPYKTSLIKELINCGITRISISSGFYDINKTTIYPNDTAFAQESLIHAVSLAHANPTCLFSIAGNIINCITPEYSIPKNLSIAIGRPLIADPEAILKFQSNKQQSCTNCGECHYYSRGLPCLFCPQKTSLLPPPPNPLSC